MHCCLDVFKVIYCIMGKGIRFYIICKRQVMLLMLLSYDFAAQLIWYIVWNIFITIWYDSRVVFPPKNLSGSFCAYYARYAHSHLCHFNPFQPTMDLLQLDFENILENIGKISDASAADGFLKTCNFSFCHNVFHF